jgi:hypothetical protein
VKAFRDDSNGGWFHCSVLAPGNSDSNRIKYNINLELDGELIDEHGLIIAAATQPVFFTRWDTVGRGL